MQYQTIPVTEYAQNCSLIYCEVTGKAALVDPGGEAQRIKQLVQQQAEQRQIMQQQVIRVEQILLTHGHLDHAGAAAELAAWYGVPVIGPQRQDEYLLQGLPVQSQMFGWPDCAPLTPDRWLHEGDTVMVGQVVLQVLHCPGHTPGHVVFYDESDKLLISGDVLFRGSVGRSDFPGGSHEQLLAMIEQKLLPLGDEVVFLPGHGERSTIGAERQFNPFLQGMS